MSPRRFARRGAIRIGLAVLTAGLLSAPSSGLARKKQADPSPPTVGLIDNINGLSAGADGTVERFTGLLVGRDGKVRQKLASSDPRPERLIYRLDGKGRTLIPSFIDSHTNVIAAGLALMTLDLSDTRSLAGAQTKIAAYARENPGRKWIIGRGWDAARWADASGTPERLPNAADLDAAVSDTPVWLLSDDGEMGWGNSVALRLAGLTGTRRPGDVLTGEATQAMTRVVPPPAPKDRDLALDKAQRYYLSLGFATAADIGTVIADWQAYRRAGDRDALRLRIVGYADGIDHMSLIAGSSPSPWLYDGHLRLAGVHFAIDRSLGARGAWLTAPYADAPGIRGAPRIDETSLRNRMSRAAMDGFQIALTAHGDAAFTEAVNAIEELAATYDGDRRWRIEGAELVDAADAQRAAAHGTRIAVSPAALPGLWRMTARRAGAGRPIWPWASLGAARLMLGSGPVALPRSPFVMIASAMSRTDIDGEPYGGVIPEGERLRFGEALAAATRGGASALFAEMRVGTLDAGQHADFLILDRDISAASPRDIAQTRILEHWVDGKRVWTQGEE